VNGGARSPSDHGAGAIDPVVHEPVRLTLMVALDGHEADFTYLKNHLGLTDGNLLFHLRKLGEAGYVTSASRRVGSRRLTFYRLTPEGREALDRYREVMRHLLGGEPPR